MRCHATGREAISSEPIEEKGWIYPTESTKPIAGALDEFRLTPYHTLQASTVKGTPQQNLHEYLWSLQLLKKQKNRLV